MGSTSSALASGGKVQGCHPDEASNASGRKDLGQRGVSGAGSGFALLLSKQESAARFQNRNRLRWREAVRGPSSPRVARVIRMTQNAKLSGFEIAQRSFSDAAGAAFDRTDWELSELRQS
jgi:hypothetical protein